MNESASNQGGAGICVGTVGMKIRQYAMEKMWQPLHKKLNTIYFKFPRGRRFLGQTRF